MAIEKNIIHSVLKKLSYGGLTVTYPDGDTYNYGQATPYAHVIIKNAKALKKIIKNVSIGFGESYADGHIEIKGDLAGPGRFASDNAAAFDNLPNPVKSVGLHKNVKQKQQSYIAHHYDLGNDFYKMWLDKSMLYSCAYFKEQTDTLEDAQQQKVDHILKKLQLREGQSLLDIGSGWGNLMIAAAKQYGVTGLGVTLSEEQLKHSVKAAKKAGVSDKISFELTNYQELPKQGVTFDRIVSVGMFEHVGRNNHKQYYKAVYDMLRPDGLSVLHTITQQTERITNAWIDKYIFPGGYIPSGREIVWALPEFGFRLTDYENLRIHYAMTLDEWQRRYHTHKKEVIKMFDEKFYRMWDFWLACSACAFRYGNLDLGQYVFTKGVQNDLPLTRVK